jgi:hypothetical protein
MQLDWRGRGREENLSVKSAFTQRVLYIKKIRKLRTSSTESVQLSSL